jgi:hypothetical protein
MSCTTCTQGNRVDSQLLVVGSQIANLTPDLSFGHNLCFRCPNESCEPILDIYVSIAFQWYKCFFNSLSFDPCNHSLNIWESIGTPIPKVGFSLGSVRVYSFTLPCTPRSMRHDSQASFLARNLATLCLGCEPKARVVTYKLWNVVNFIKMLEIFLYSFVFQSNFNLLLFFSTKENESCTIINKTWKLFKRSLFDPHLHPILRIPHNKFLSQDFMLYSKKCHLYTII